MSEPRRAPTHNLRRSAPMPWGSKGTVGEVAELIAAIEEDQLHLLYQPIVDLRSHRVTSAEALLRWTRPGGERVPPEQIVEFSERCGLTLALTEWIFHRAIQDATAWRDQGLRLHVAVNVAANQSSCPEHAAGLLRLLSVYGYDPAHLTVEVTETTVMRDPAGAQATLNLLREAGVGVALDDFGTGDSSLSRLQDLAFTELKIDKTFVARATEHATSARLVNFAAMLGRGLGLTVVAEGVEDPETLAHVRRCRVARVQGYLFARPVPVNELGATVGEVDESPFLLSSSLTGPSGDAVPHSLDAWADPAPRRSSPSAGRSSRPRL